MTSRHSWLLYQPAVLTRPEAAQVAQRPLAVSQERGTLRRLQGSTGKGGAGGGGGWLVGGLAGWPTGPAVQERLRDICLMSAVRLAPMCAPTRPHMCLYCPFSPTGVYARWRLTSDTVASASGSSVPSTRALATSNPTFAALH